MCESCGCANTAPGREPAVAHTDGAQKADHRISVEVTTRLLAANDRVAALNRRLLDAHGVLALNLMSSPGSGKTSLLEATADHLAKGRRIAVIEGDLATDNDARRMRAKNVPAVQITTGQACHLDAEMVRGALDRLDLHAIDILFIENVGNLVCPASFDLGQHLDVAMLSVTEGDDKPAKYPVLFRKADLVLLSKADLLEAIGDFDPAAAAGHVRNLGNAAPILTISARRSSGIPAWIAWLEDHLVELRARLGPDRHAMAHAHFHPIGKGSTHDDGA